jgi:osmotically-inducible protein OsmY
MINRRNIIVTAASAAVALSALTGCKYLPGNEPNDGRSSGRAQDDKAITKRIEDRLHDESVYKFDSVDVKTFAGIVQLSGFVDLPAQKVRAEELARKVPGVTQIVNALVVKPGPIPTPTGQPSGERLPPPDAGK